MAELQKSQSYHANSDAPQESIDRINRRLQSEMRTRIRQIAPAPIGSEKWFEVAEHLQHLAAVAVMEEFGADRGLATVEASASGAVTLGKSQDTSTVWERDNLCVRLVVEEGKVNLLTRILADFKRELVVSNGAAGDASGAPREQVRGFEMALGLVLRSGLSAVEAVQTLDVRALLDHIAVSLDSATNPQSSLLLGAADDVLMQEFLAISYLAAIFRFLPSINEDVVVGHFADLQLLEKVVAHAERFGNFAVARSAAAKHVSHTSPSIEIPIDHFNGELLGAYCDFLSAFVDSDAFKAQIATFFPSRPAKVRFVTVFEPIVKSRMGPTPDAELKKKYRPLTDVLLRFK